jgi:hypothetical protein
MAITILLRPPPTKLRIPPLAIFPNARRPSSTAQKTIRTARHCVAHDPARHCVAHDPLNAAGTTAALRAAVQARKHFPRSTERSASIHDCATHIMVGQHVAGTDDHHRSAVDVSRACEFIGDPGIEARLPIRDSGRPSRQRVERGDVETMVAPLGAARASHDCTVA